MKEFFGKYKFVCLGVFILSVFFAIIIFVYYYNYKQSLLLSDFFIEDGKVYYHAGHLYNTDLVFEVEGVDLESFEKLRYGYAKDKKKVYYCDLKYCMEDEILDTSTLRILKRGQYIRDKKNIYKQNLWNFEKIGIIEFIRGMF